MNVSVMRCANCLPAHLAARVVAGAVGLCIAVVSLTTLARPAQAFPAGETVSVADERHDVRIFRKFQGLSPSERRSIDLREVQITPREGHVRFTVRWREVLRTRNFDQMVFFNLPSASDETAEWSGNVGFSPQRADLSYATLYFDATGTDYEACDSLTATVLRRTDRVRLEVPERCIPEGPADISVSALTGYFRSDAGGPWSQDRVRFPSGAVLR